MRMDEIGYHHRHDETFLIDRPNGAGDWLFLVIKAPAVFRIDGKDVKAKANSYILYTPEYPEYYHADNEEYIDDWIHFGPDEEEETLIRRLLPLNTPVYIGDVAAVSKIVRNMCYEFYSAHIHRQQTVDLYLKMLVYKVHEQIELRQPSQGFSETLYGERLMWIRECIYRWPCRDWSIDAIAEELALSRSRFQHLYSDTFGTSVSQDLILSRIQYAANLLKHSNMSIEEISNTCLYSTPSYFVRQFKKVMGVTPNTYRQQQDN
ncbi:MAG: helix-turn-helix transcriptional regulator [Oscillospiraceae bacterium]|nr:helix-turn-helix transcriptional regulator [Oscillospiraceae bacterium]